MDSVTIDHNIEIIHCNTPINVRSKGSFALGDDDLISFCRHELIPWLLMGLFALDDDDKLQYDDIIVHWVQYPFHDDFVVQSPLSSSSSPSANEPLGS